MAAQKVTKNVMHVHKSFLNPIDFHVLTAVAFVVA